MRWSDFESACEAAGVAVSKHETAGEFLYDITPRQADALRAALPDEVSGMLDGGPGLACSSFDMYEHVTGWNPVMYDDGYGEVLTLCDDGQVSVEEYGPDNLAADGYPLLGFYQLPVANGETWRAWVVDSEESRAYMAKNDGVPGLVKLL